jgi:phage N-6-adenine-methyltransferase
MGFYSEEVSKSSLIDTWSTPKDFFKELNDMYSFGLDAAALQSSALCEKWYGPDHPNNLRRDAFDWEWHKDCDGKPIFLNPPYGRTIGLWLRKANEEAQKGAVVVALVPSRTDTKWWHDYVIQHRVAFIKGRLKFGNQKNPAPFPSAVVHMEAR